MLADIVPVIVMPFAFAVFPGCLRFLVVDEIIMIDFVL
jgi:hypothetical protein